MSSFNTIDPSAKLSIATIEGPNVTVTAQFNPKEVQVDRSTPWQKQKKAKDVADLEFTGLEPMTMSFELLFDAFEGGDVASQIEGLYKLGKPQTIDGAERPPKVKVVWGQGGTSGALSALPQFECVVESVSVKYTMFKPDGTVLRATANVKLKQAAALKRAKPQ
jgi:hypothetical protein